MDLALRKSRETPLGGADCDAHRRTRPHSHNAAPVPSPARGPTSKTGIGEEAGTQFVLGTRAYSAHIRLHVNAPTQCRFAQSYIIGSTRFGRSPLRRTATIFARTDRAILDAHRRARPLSRSATLAPSPASGPPSKTGIGDDAGTHFVPGTRAYSARNRLHFNAPTLRGRPAHKSSRLVRR
jgi:hypothetical protein